MSPRRKASSEPTLSNSTFEPGLYIIGSITNRTRRYITTNANPNTEIVTYTILDDHDHRFYVDDFAPASYSKYRNLSLFRFISNRIKRKTAMQPIPYAFRRTIIRLRKVRHSKHQSPVLLDARLTDALRGVILCLLHFFSGINLKIIRQ